ncbi:unnamed protein product [Mytilus edulis]|uniref:Reverse transcriptase domain-containing protein n=1 Tax=Mytilus edulis TaxID=6550 RepID=A0A8S3QQL4_MYTED|nr:unnamed protein product [Mytilus edulis]
MTINLTNSAAAKNNEAKAHTEVSHQVDVMHRIGLITTAFSGDALLKRTAIRSSPLKGAYVGGPKHLKGLVQADNLEAKEDGNRKKPNHFFRQWPIKQDKREDIIIGTLNVQNVKSNALYIKNLLRDVHVICIQEHWLFNAEKKIIAEITENSGYIAKSVDDNDDPDFNISMKRGYGGVAIIWKKEINENIKELIDGGNRIQAIHIQQGDKPICLINVYMPSDSKNADIEYKDTLAQIDEMIEKYKDTHEIIVCGDMNGSLDRSSTPHDKILKTFCKEKCIGNTEKCPVKETFYHQNGMSKGQIDYFLFKSNSEIINKIRQIDVLDTDPENTSDHVPVILTLNSQLKKVREKATTIIAKPKWTDCDHQIYKEVINKELPKLMQKSKGIIEKDIKNLEKLLHKAGEAAIPKYRRKIKIKSKGKAIWNEQIDKASKQSKNAFKVWRQHGAPQERSNELKIKMTAAKRILRKAQRQAYASQRESTAGKIMKASNSDTKLFYKLINMQRKTPLINTKILKLNEKTAEDGPSIMNIWQEHFQQLATPTIEENFDTEKLELVEIQNNIIESIEREKGKLWILLRNLYKGMSIKVKWEGQCTEDVMVLQGIQQGAKLSTTLYKCYNNVILDSILKSGLGACIGDIQVPAPTCADDIAVLANSTADAQGILDIVQHHTSRDLVKINPTKSEAVLYNAKGSNISTLKFEDNDINITNETKHLGIKRNEQNRANISERIRTGRATIYSLLGAGLHVRRGFSPMVAYKLWRTYAVPRSIYGLEVMNLLAKEKDMLELAERKILRQIQGLPNNTANMAVYTLVGAEPIAITLDKNVLTFFMNIVRNPGTIECEILRRQIVFSDQRGKDFINRVEKTLSKYNLKSSSYYIENPLNKMEWKRLVGIKIKEYWKNECHNEKMEKTSLKYIEIQNNPLNEAHNIWKSVKNNSKDVKAGEIKARISTQTYIFQAKRAKFDPKCVYKAGVAESHDIPYSTGAFVITHLQYYKKTLPNKHEKC